MTEIPDPSMLRLPVECSHKEPINPYCECHNFYYDSSDTCPVCEGINISVSAVNDLHYVRKNRFIGRPPVCNHCCELAGKEYEFLSSYPCDTIKATNGLLHNKTGAGKS